MKNDALLTEIKDGVGIITLNRPNVYNALDLDLKLQLSSTLTELGRETTVKCIVLTGTGKGFCSGADLSEMMTGPTPQQVFDDLTSHYYPIIKKLSFMHKPVIGAINGPMAGAGIGLGLACDYKIMVKSASMKFAFANISLVSDAGSTWFLARSVGYTKALEIIYGGEKVMAEECQRLGLVNDLAEDQEDLMTKTMDLARRLGQKAPLAYDATKKALNFALNHGLLDTVVFEAELQKTLINSHDNREGVMAFMQKRSPNFKGKY